MGLVICQSHLHIVVETVAEHVCRMLIVIGRAMISMTQVLLFVFSKQQLAEGLSSH